MKKENLKNEKIQTDVTEEVKSADLSQCCEQNTKEKSNEPSWRSCALKFLDAKFDNSKSLLVTYQYSRLIDDKWTPFVPYCSYSHFSSSKPDVKSIILGSLDNLDVGIYLFKLLYVCVYRDCWVPSNFDFKGFNPMIVLKLNVFECEGCKGYEVVDLLYSDDLKKEFKK